jgi:hypothetical protein
MEAIYSSETSVNFSNSIVHSHRHKNFKSKRIKFCVCISLRTYNTFLPWVIHRRYEYLDYMASNGTMTDEWRIGKVLGGVHHGLMEVVSRNLPGGNERNHEQTQGSRCADRHSNWAPPKYESTKPTHQVAQNIRINQIKMYLFKLALLHGLMFILWYYQYHGARGSVVGWGTVTHCAGSSPDEVIGFAIDLILPAALLSWGRLSL